jgi:hypothetical protein
MIRRELPSDPSSWVAVVPRQIPERLATSGSPTINDAIA